MCYNCKRSVIYRNLLMEKIILTKVLLLLFVFAQAQQASIDKNYECKIENPENGDCKEGEIRNLTTTFPKTSPAGDYKVKGYLVKVAYPIVEDSSRVWVKGGDKLNKVQVFAINGKAISDVVTLKAPFHTALISLSAKHEKVNVKFAGSKQVLKNSDKILMAQPTNLKDLTQEDDEFSIMFYGCFQPFKVNQETGKSEVLHEGDTLNYVIRQMFTAVAQERKFNYKPYEEKQFQKSKLLTNPKLLLGGGDQIYTDAGYAELDFKDHPLSAWAHKCSDPYPLLDTLEYAKHMNRCYLHFNSFDCFEKVQSILPSISTWDDHEIRDGWGSHGDEYDDNGNISSDLKPYYFLSRQAFIDHQYSLGPNVATKQTLVSNQSLAQQTKVNGVDVFVMDLRSNRNNCEKKTISDEQMNSFKEWCKNLEENKEVVIVSSIPFFYVANSVFTALAEDIYEGELRDDIIDSWVSEANKSQRDVIIQELIKLRQRNIRPIILSGDVHIGALITAWYKNPETDKYEKLCYEMISSGLSHESLGEARSGLSSSLRRRSRKVEKDDPALFVNDIGVYPVFDFTRGRLNFGALKFKKEKSTIASLYVLGDNKEEITERELELSWNESYKNYRKRCDKPFLWYLIPWKWSEKKLPEVPYKTITVKELLSDK